jgi:ABC-type nitrate/sulfonate/bicarbonate transport system substrate-binding protein
MQPWRCLPGVSLIAALTVSACGSAAPQPAQSAASASTNAPVANSSAGAAANAKPSVQRVAMKSAFSTPSATEASIFGAKDGGYFDREGLDVEVSQINSGAPILGAIQNGEVPLGFVAAQQIIQSSLQGADVVMVGGFLDTFVGDIWVVPSIQTPEQLKGKTLGVTGIGSSSHTNGMLILDRLGLKDQVKFLPTGNPEATLAAIQTGNIDGAPLTPPTGLLARKAGLHSLVDTSKLGILAQNSTVMTTRGYLAQHPDIVERYLRAIMSGSKRLNTDREFAAKSIGKWLRVDDPEIIDETLRYLYGKYRDDGAINVPAVQEQLDVTAQTIPAAANAKPEQFMDLAIVQKIRASGFVP